MSGGDGKTIKKHRERRLPRSGCLPTSPYQKIVFAVKHGIGHHGNGIKRICDAQTIGGFRNIHLIARNMINCGNRTVLDKYVNSQGRKWEP